MEAWCSPTSSDLNCKISDIPLNGKTALVFTIQTHTNSSTFYKSLQSKHC